MANGNGTPPDKRGLATLLFELGIDATPGVGDTKALLYDAPRSLRDAWHADTPLGKAGHVGLAALAGLSAVPLLGAPLDAARAFIKTNRRFLNPRTAANRLRFSRDPYYHGTFAPMPPGKDWENLGDQGLRYNISGEQGPGIYLTRSPMEAGQEYADPKKRPWMHEGRGQPRVYPTVVREDKLADLSKIQGGRPITDYPTSYWPKAAEDLRKRNERLRDAGYHGFKYGDHVIMFDPKYIRSPWARFKDLESKDMLAGLAGLGFSARLAQGRENDG
jgi:hypothetical protein